MKLFSTVAVVLVWSILSSSRFWCIVAQDTVKEPNERKCTDETTRTVDNTFDYIVVGAGAGGGIVASRLATAGYSTLLLDAGPRYQDQPLTTVPIFWPLSTEEPDIEWRFRSSNSAIDPGRDSVLYPRASAIGGCTIHNAMLAMYPFPEFFSDLQNMTGDDEFAEEKMRARFQRIESCEYVKSENKLLSKGHGFEGFMSTSLADIDLITDRAFFDIQLLTVVTYFILSNVPQNPLVQFFRSIRKFQLPFALFDTNAPGNNRREGAHLTPSSISPAKGNIRSSVADLLYETEQSTSKLTIRDNSFVTQILLDDSNVAYGVQVQEGTALYSVATGTRTLQEEKTYYANKEIILAGGTFNTPQILMLSGIGPKDHLTEFNIPVRVDLPGVGANLHDKLEATMNWNMPRRWKVFDQGCTFARPSLEEDPCYVDFINGQFPNIYTSSGSLLGIQRKTDPSLERPDMYLQISANDFSGYNDGWIEKGVYSGSEQTLTINTSTPRMGPSKGTIRLQSSDPFTAVLVDFNQYDDEDLERTGRIVEEMRKAFRKLQWIGVVGKEVAPGPNVKSFDDIKAWVRSVGWGHHPLGTAKMGNVEEDGMAVVNGQFRVHGVERLRVVDGSVFPVQPGFFPMVPIYMMAEKAADDIIRDAEQLELQC